MLFACIVGIQQFDEVGDWMRKVLAIILGLMVVGMSGVILWGVTPVVEVLAMFENEYEFTRHFDTSVAERWVSSLVTGK